MPVCLLYRAIPKSCRPHYYRVEIACNLLEEVSVLREWGLAGSTGRSTITLYSNLRHASEAADRWRNRALRRGYLRAD